MSISRNCGLSSVSKTNEIKSLSTVKEQVSLRRFALAQATVNTTSANVQRPGLIAAGDAYKLDLCWNPLYGPVHMTKIEKPKCSVEDSSQQFKAFTNCQNKTTSTKDCRKTIQTDPALEQVKHVASSLPFSMHFTPLLGLVSLADLGFKSDDEANKAMKAKVVTLTLTVTQCVFVCIFSAQQFFSF